MTNWRQAGTQTPKIWLGGEETEEHKPTDPDIGSNTRVHTNPLTSILH